MISASKSNNVATLALDNLTIYNALEVKATFLATLAEHSTIEVNLADVAEIDCAGLQLMVSLKETALEQKKSIAFIAHSHEVINFLDLLDLTEFFGDPVMISKS